MLMYHSMRSVSIRSVHRLALDSVQIVHTDCQTYPGTKAAIDSCKKDTFCFRNAGTVLGGCSQLNTYSFNIPHM